jgi:hypothetical protein
MTANIKAAPPSGCQAGETAPINQEYLNPVPASGQDPRAAMTMPPELRNRDAWLVWRSRKVPINPRTGQPASPTDSSTWGSFDEALAALRSGDYSGLGIVFNGDGLAGVDLDNCLDPETGEIQPWATSIINDFASYTEFSPSGTGAHIIFKSDFEHTGLNRGNIEIYSRGRYFTFTGRLFDPSLNAVKDCSQQHRRLHAIHAPATVEAGQLPFVESDDSALTSEDKTLIAGITASVQGKAFKGLFGGHWQGDYPSQSEADYALAGILAFVTGKDCRQMDRIFRASNLYREKWDQRRGDRTYGAQTIGRAIADSPPDAGVIFAASAPVMPAPCEAWIADALRTGSVSRFIDRAPPTLDWVFKGSLLTGVPGFLVGPGAVGKSTTASHMALATATGRDILPGIFTPTRPGKVVCLFSEDDENVLHHRMQTLIKQFFSSDEQAMGLLRRNLKIVTATGRDVRFLYDSKNVKESAFFTEFLKALTTIENLRLVIIDPVSRIHGGEENDNRTGTVLVTLLERIARQTGAAVIALHHVSKRAGIEAGAFNLDSAMHQDAARGASGLTNAVRWQCNLFGLPEKDCRKLIGVSDARAGQFLAIRVSKKNFGPPEETKFLERGVGGVLKPFIKTSLIAPDLDELARNLILTTVLTHEGQFLTKRLLIDGNCRTWKKDDPRVTRSVLEQTISSCILNGELFERQGKNSSGKSIYFLSLK